MVPSLAFGVLLAAPAAPIPQDAVPAPTGPAPHILFLKSDGSNPPHILVYENQKVKVRKAVTAIENGKPVTKVVEEEETRVIPTHRSLKDLKATFATAVGRPVGVEEVVKQSSDGVVLLLSANGKPADKAWLRTLLPDTVIGTAEGLAGSIPPSVTTPVPTAAPRLVLLGTDANGKVKVAFNPAADGNTAPGLRGRRQVVMIRNGGVAQQLLLQDATDSTPQPATTPPPTKPLEDVAFDAYDLSGKLVAREEALKRLRAGGLVLIAGDNRVPDASYLKIFRGDLLVLVSAELANVPDNSNPRIKPAIQPGVFAPAVVPAPALPVLPAKPALVKPAVIKVAPARLPVNQAVPAEKPVEAKPAEKKSKE